MKWMSEWISEWLQNLIGNGDEPDLWYLIGIKKCSAFAVYLLSNSGHWKALLLRNGAEEGIKMEWTDFFL